MMTLRERHRAPAVGCIPVLRILYTRLPCLLADRAYIALQQDTNPAKGLIMTGLLIGTALALVALLGLVSAPRLAMAQGGSLSGNASGGRRVETGGEADESEAADPTWASFMRAL
jgi:hypothetical protein